MMFPASADKSEEKKTYRDLTSEISQYMGPWLKYVENAVDQNPDEKSVSFNLDCQSHSESNLAESGNNIETDVADAQHPTIDDQLLLLVEAQFAESYKKKRLRNVD